MSPKAFKMIIRRQGRGGTNIALKPHKVIILDRLFNNNDQLKTNAALQMKDAGIEFKTM
ncbi:hypothetical protein KKG56_06125 [bacterium]|nr:hypothetical protein [bacterium]